MFLKNYELGCHHKGSTGKYTLYVVNELPMCSVCN